MGRFVGEKRVGRIEDVDGFDGVALLDRIHDVLPFGDFAEDGMFSVEPVGWDVGDEELAAVRSWTGVGHGEDAGFAVFEAGMKFVAEAVAGSAHAASCRVAALDHEVFDDSVELDAVVVTAF